jgi:hypothetical protein
MTKTRALAVTASAFIVLLVAACSSGETAAAHPTTTPASWTPGSISPGASYRPPIDPAAFRAVVDNPWFPLKPGARWVYAGVKDGKPVRDVVTVTHRTKTIAGVPCVVVDDRLSEAGALAEHTIDYYTQDNHGNVWYFGEDTAELDANGKVTSTGGTWHAGQGGAQPGIFMEADPVVGHAYRQEYDAGNAEDQYAVVGLASRVHVPYGSFDNAMLTVETTRLEPDALDHKYYVKDVGEVAEIAVKGAPERGLLVSYRPG